MRITAQLIKADDGTHIWAENYDRELTDVFAIQEDIARAIAASLRMPLGLKPGENLVNNRNIDPDSYDQLLRARGLIVSRTAVGDQSRPELMKSAALLRTVVKRNPNFAPAWAWLAAADYLVATTETQIDQSFDKAKAAAEALRQEGEAAGKRAIELDPDLPGAYSSLGLLVWSRGKLLEADALYQKMLALTPEGHSEELAAYGIRLAETGHTREALALLEKGHAVDPLDPSEITFAAVGRWVMATIPVRLHLPNPPPLTCARKLSPWCTDQKANIPTLPKRWMK